MLKDAALRRRLADAIGTRWTRDLRRSGINEKIITAEIKFSTTRTAPVLVLPCLSMEEMDRYPDRQRRRAECAMGIQSVAAAIQNLLLAAHAVGLGACWCCAPLFCQGLAARVLRLPRTWEPQALITIGFPRHSPPRPPRKPLEEVMRVL